MTPEDTANENQNRQEVTLCQKKKKKEEGKKTQRKGRSQTTMEAIKVKASVGTVNGVRSTLRQMGRRLRVSDAPRVERFLSK